MTIPGTLSNNGIVKQAEEVASMVTAVESSIIQASTANNYTRKQHMIRMFQVSEREFEQGYFTFADLGEQKNLEVLQALVNGLAAEGISSKVVPNVPFGWAVNKDYQLYELRRNNPVTR